MNILFIILALATLAVLIAGIVIMARGGKVNKELSNKFMVMRVVLQALTLAVLAILFLMMGKG